MSCSVRLCPNKRVCHLDGITFFKFPRDEEKKQQWLHALHLFNLQPRKSHIVCSDHFIETDFLKTKNGKRVLRRIAVPILANHLKPNSTIAPVEDQKLRENIETNANDNYFLKFTIKQEPEIEIIDDENDYSCNTNTHKFEPAIEIDTDYSIPSDIFEPTATNDDTDFPCNSRIFEPEISLYEYEPYQLYNQPIAPNPKVKANQPKNRITAQHMREYRQRLKNDPVRYAHYLNQERIRYQRRKERKLSAERLKKLNNSARSDTTASN